MNQKLVLDIIKRIFDVEVLGTAETRSAWLN